jgi:hypothetical protein
VVDLVQDLGVVVSIGLGVLIAVGIGAGVVRRRRTAR